MGVLIIQILTTILTTIISLIALRKDERSRTEALKKEVSFIKPILFIVAGISILNTGVSYYTAKQNKHVTDSVNVALNNNLDTSRSYILKISKQNTDLRKALTDNSLAQSRLIIASQQKSANQLANAASNLSSSINGIDQPPIFSFILNSQFKPIGILRNIYSEPIFNFTCTVSNFLNIQECPIMFVIKNKSNMISQNCYILNTTYLGLSPVMAISASRGVDLPNYNSVEKGKYLVIINLKNKTFAEEAIYEFRKGVFWQSTRIVELTNDLKSIIKKTVYNSEFGINQLKKVSWDEEFPDMYVKNIGIGDFTPTFFNFTTK